MRFERLAGGFTFCKISKLKKTVCHPLSPMTGTSHASLSAPKFNARV
jgi:hypothetical protein